MTDSDPIPALLRDAVAVLESAGAEAALIGGCARNAYAAVRPTKDVDFVVAVDEGNYGALTEAARARGFMRATAVGGAPGAVPISSCSETRRGGEWIFCTRTRSSSAARWPAQR